MSVYLRAKFQVSSITLTNFRFRGWVGSFTPPLPQNEPLKSPPRLGLKSIERTSAKKEIGMFLHGSYWKL